MKSVLLASSVALALVLTGCNATGMMGQRTSATTQSQMTQSHQSYGHQGHTHNYANYQQSQNKQSMSGYNSNTNYGNTSYGNTYGNNAMTQMFVCENDAKPVIKRISDNQIQLTVDDATTTMTAAPSGSGERYVSSKGIYGKGGEWQQKGNMAVFTYHGYGSPTNCRLAR